jgi:hypothetical protein
VRTKQRKKIGHRPRLAAPMAVGVNVCWSMDPVSDKLADGRSFRILTAVDQFTERMCMSGSRSIHARNDGCVCAREGTSRARQPADEHHSR